MDLPQPLHPGMVDEFDAPKLRRPLAPRPTRRGYIRGSASWHKFSLWKSRIRLPPSPFRGPTAPQTRSNVCSVAVRSLICRSQHRAAGDRAIRATAHRPCPRRRRSRASILMSIIVPGTKAILSSLSSPSAAARRQNRNRFASLPTSGIDLAICRLRGTLTFVTVPPEVRAWQEVRCTAAVLIVAGTPADLVTLASQA